MSKAFADVTMFYGDECVYCHKMMPIVEQLEKELSVTIQKLEVWHNEGNASRMSEYETILREACGGGIGVPNFINTTTKKALCGYVPYDEFKKWFLSSSETVASEHMSRRP